MGKLRSRELKYLIRALSSLAGIQAQVCLISKPMHFLLLLCFLVWSLGQWYCITWLLEMQNSQLHQRTTESESTFYQDPQFIYVHIKNWQTLHYNILRLWISLLLSHSVDQCFPMRWRWGVRGQERGGCFPPPARDTWQCLKIFMVVTTGSGWRVLLTSSG